MDFGCGPGRFTKDLATVLNGFAIGADPMEALVTLAPSDPCVQYVVMPEGQIPLLSQSVDVLCSCLVLGGIHGEPLKQTLAEMDRVLRTGGLLFLVENTSKRPSAHYWTFRSTCEYQMLCTFADCGISIPSRSWGADFHNRRKEKVTAASLLVGYGRKYFEQFYSTRDWHFYRPLLALILGHSEPGPILDVGAGTGLFIELALLLEFVVHWGSRT